MKKRTLYIAFSLWLGASFLTASTIFSGVIAFHAQHQGHDRHSHSQTWCGWMCTAGQAIEAPSLHLAQNGHPIGLAFFVLPSFILFIFAFSPGSRDPPLDLK